MARIRTLKPDFMDSADVRALSRDARLFFLQLLTEADDEGRLKHSPKRLAGVLYPGDEDVDGSDIERWIKECEGRGMLQTYTAGGQKLIWVVTFTTHQKISHPTPSKLPGPENATDDLDSCITPEDSRITPEDSRSVSEKLSQEREQGSGTGNREVEQGVPENGHTPTDLKGLNKLEPKGIRALPAVIADQATQILTSARTSDQKKLTSLEKQEMRPHIIQWLNVGYTPEALLAALSTSPGMSGKAVGIDLRRKATPQSRPSVGDDALAVAQRFLQRHADEDKQ